MDIRLKNGTPYYQVDPTLGSILVELQLAEKIVTEKRPHISDVIAPHVDGVKWSVIQLGDSYGFLKQSGFENSRMGGPDAAAMARSLGCPGSIIDLYFASIAGQRAVAAANERERQRAFGSK